MGLGLIIEFVGICFCYKKEDANVEDKDEKAEVKTKTDTVKDMTDYENDSLIKHKLSNSLG